jgi:CBS domain-containing protein
MKVRYAMTENPHAISLGATVEEAAKVMTAFGVSLVPVIFEGRPVGMVTEHSLTTQVLAWARDPHRTPIREVMNPRPTCVNENDDIELAKAVLKHADGHRALVCRDDGSLTGIVTLMELERISSGETGKPKGTGQAGAF